MGPEIVCDKVTLREELKKRLEILIAELEAAQDRDQCYEVRDYVDCPPEGPPPPRKEPHPYIPDRTIYNYPVKVKESMKVTLDGRLAQPFRPLAYYFEDLPLRVPPWSKPRYPSVELRAGKNYSGCDCWRKNGMQDSCRRWDCDGRPECKLLACPPSIHPPILGIRHKNGFETVPKCKIEEEPFGPFPMHEIESFTKQSPPRPPMKSPMPEDFKPCD